MLRLLGLIVMLTMLWALPAHAQQDFLPPEQAFRLTIIKQADAQVRLDWKISKGYYLYRKQMKVEGDPAGSAQQVEWPVGTLKTDETFGESEVYHDHVEVRVKAPDAQALTVGWQGCAEAGLCYPPQTRKVNLADVAATPSSSTGVPAPNANRAALGALGEDQDLAGANLQAALQNPWVLGSFGFVFFVLALAMFGFYELQLPAVLRRRLNNASPSQHARAAAIVGELGTDEFLARLARARQGD